MAPNNKHNINGSRDEVAQDEPSASDLAGMADSIRDKPLAAREYHQPGDGFRPVMLEVMDEETGEVLPLFSERKALREALKEKEKADEESN